MKYQTLTDWDLAAIEDSVRKNDGLEAMSKAALLEKLSKAETVKLSYKPFLFQATIDAIDQDRAERDEINRESVPYQAGGQSFRGGAPITANPYPANTTEHSLWDKGWEDMQDAAEETWEDRS